MKMHVYKSYCEYTNAMRYHLQDARELDMETPAYGWIYVCEIEFEDDPGNDAEIALAAISREEEKIRAKFQMDLMALGEAKQKYLALENDNAD